MHIRRRKSFFLLLGLIREIENTPTNLELIREYNYLLLSEILDAESKILRHRSKIRELNKSLKIGRPDRAKSKEIKTIIKRTTGYIKNQKDMIFILKSFGDALVYLFLDKFSIKHAFFEVDKLGIKQGPGTLSSKAGQKLEIACMESLLNEGIPAILCDITNVLRYGDVCLLADSDPLLIEVKSGARMNQRGRRQIEKLRKLHTFFETDLAESLRGLTGPVKRIPIEIPERIHVDSLNSCIATAKMKGHASVSPEPGLTYVAIYEDTDFESIFAGISDQPGLIFFLNSAKNEHAWTPYIPFILTVRDGEHLIDFIEGRLFLVVFLDPRPLCAAMETGGWKVRFQPDGDYAIQCFHPKTRAFMRISEQFLERAAYEFVSLAWMAEVHDPTKAEAEFRNQQNGSQSNDYDAAAHEQLLLDLLGENDPWLTEPAST